MNGIEAIRGICNQYPEAKILILATFDHDEYIFEGIQAGALGYILKAMSSSKLRAAVRSAYRGDSWLETSIARKIVDEFSRIRPPVSHGSRLAEPLNEQELEILRLLTAGLRTREIAAQLHLAEGTVKNYISTLMGKLNVRDRAQAVLRARELNLI